MALSRSNSRRSPQQSTDSTRSKPSTAAPERARNLILVLGDQLDGDSVVFDGFDPRLDVVWMAETDVEATHVWCHKMRLVAFFAPMRHFCQMLVQKGFCVDYHELPCEKKELPTTKGAVTSEAISFASVLNRSLQRWKPEKCIVLEPGDYRVQQHLREAAARYGVPLEERESAQFFCTRDRFQQWRKGRKQLVLDMFYREMRRDHGILIDASGQPEGGSWNYDSENRQKFGKQGPPSGPPPMRFAPDAITRQVIAMVETRFSEHPGSTEHFDLPVDRAGALDLLSDFVAHRLPQFGQYQDAMWAGREELFHSRLSHAMNIGLLNPREVVWSAVEAYRGGTVSLSNCEGFVRQILGWREYVRGIYWDRMPTYVESNALDCDPERDVPQCYWDGQTDMVCVRDSMRLVLQLAYAHHIQRLMVLGLFAQLLGVHPLKFHQWHMAMYADAIDWVSAPNTIGMSQYGDGGLMSTKPYCASGNYIQRMSNYCGTCHYQPSQATGPNACPFTTLYWDFLDRHRDRFSKNMRMSMQIRNLERKSSEELVQIRVQAKQLREDLFVS